jgi:hypothetical protein
MTMLIRAGAVVVLAAAALAPIAHADPGDQAGLSKPFAGEAGSPFTGVWRGHGELVTIEPDGTGTEKAARGQLNFMMGAVQQGPGGGWTQADGHVVSGFLERGAFINMQLVDSGKGVLFSAGGGDNGFPMCRMVGGAAVNPADCGA